MTLVSGCRKSEVRIRSVRLLTAGVAAMAALLAFAASAMAQSHVIRDPAEPLSGKPHPKILARPAGRFSRQSVDEKGMRSLISDLVKCGTRLTLASWDDPKRGPGCARDHIVARFNVISKETGGKLQVVVDRFAMTSERTHNQPAAMQNVYGILPGTDPALSKTVFIVSGHFDSMPSFKDIMNPDIDAPGADDDASGVAVSVECARLLSKMAEAHGGFRSTLLFAAVSGEEQGLLGSTHLVEWVKQNGYSVGG